MDEVLALANQKLLNEDNLLNIAWLSRGLELAKSVARIITPNGTGTGFLIAPNLLMTNNHVIPTQEVAKNSVAEFNYQIQWMGKIERTRRYQVIEIVRRNESLDYTIVKLAGQPGSKKRFGFIDLNNHGEATVNDYVSIIQHPMGGFKQIALTDNKVTADIHPYIQYTTDTMRGSSGAPVFNQRWEIVAIHHEKVQLPEVNGERWFMNKGVKISQIIQNAKLFQESVEDSKDDSGQEVNPVTDSPKNTLYYLLLGCPVIENELSDLIIEINDLIKAGRSKEEIKNTVDQTVNSLLQDNSGLNNTLDEILNTPEELAPLLLFMATGIAAGATVAFTKRRRESLTTEAALIMPPSEELINFLKEDPDLSDGGAALRKALEGATEILQNIIDELQERVLIDDLNGSIVCLAVGKSLGEVAYNQAHSW